MDLSRAKGVPGVVAAYTGKDMAQGGVGPLPCGWLLPDLKIPEYRGVATDKVNFVGHAVAVVIGETPYAARDGADQVVVDYDVLPAVTDGEKAVQPGAPQIHENAPGNVAFRWSIGDKDKTAAAIKGAAPRRQAAPDQPPAHPQRHRAAGVDGLVQLGDGRAHPAGSPPRIPTCTGCSWRRSCWACPSTRCG